MITVLIAEPNPILLLGIRTVLERQPGVAIAAEVRDAAQLSAAFLAVPHDVIIVELGLLQEIGIAALRDWRSLKPDTRILVHSYEIDTAFGAQAARFGAVGYLSSDCSSSDLCNAVAEVAAGRPYISRALGAALATEVCFRASNREHVALNQREQKVFQMLSIGLKIRDVAKQLGKSVETIQMVKRRIMARMRLPETSALVQRAIAQTWQEHYDDPAANWPVAAEASHSEGVTRSGS